MYYFGRHLGVFWQQKCVQKSGEILEAILEAKKGVPRIFWGRPGGMRGGPGEDNGGVREPISAENRGRGSKAGARSSRLRYLARRPRWGGGSLRAFRRAGVIFDAVLFESCVGGVAVAMTFSSIFHFKFWFRWGVVLAAFLGAFWRPLWVLRASLGLLLGVTWGSLG